MKIQTDAIIISGKEWQFYAGKILEFLENQDLVQLRASLRNREKLEFLIKLFSNVGLRETERNSVVIEQRVKERKICQNCKGKGCENCNAGKIYGEGEVNIKIPCIQIKLEKIGAIRK